MLVFWLGPMSIAGAKWSRYLLALLPFVYIAAGIGVVVVWRMMTKLTRSRGWVGGKAVAGAARAASPARWAIASAIVIVFLAMPVYVSLKSLPYPNLYLNAFGGGRIGYFFPHDEFYDLGARESVRYIAENAPFGASVASEIPGVVGYYLDRFGRNDIRIEIMSNPKFDLSRSAPDYAILQIGRLYIENSDTYRLIERRYKVVQESTSLGATTSRVFLTRPVPPEKRDTVKLN
jgi:hypothetical protein